ncbi:NADP-specific glutamate dehydrogenase [Myxococcota bacterium]|nr:NADP-specific glutamate dehydrogenase [Myxococcota bacterium]MBU1431603.1 NADP-specific glutamate dehydrogenase [Myxococcota bacterium]MBU1900676.1 NADP-specific glutamate dehydrogenase [Myxococcota bacterium]
MHAYPARVLEDLKRRIPWEAEFLQAVEEVFLSLSPALAADPIYESERILERIVEPERVLGFRVVWLDDRGRMNVNRGYRVQFNSALGPYKGGLRFHPSVSLSGLKFLGFEQTFKNALTGISMGGGKGGSDFQPKGRSDAEIMRFCQSFMTELYRHIGPDTDVPAGDIGVGGREIGYLFGQYKRLSNTFSGTLTGKGLNWGGSRLRPEATGYGVTYFAEEMLKLEGQGIAGKTVTVSGFGNVAWGVVKKVTELGGKVVTLSGPDGFIYDPEGVSGEKIEYMLRMRLSGRDEVRPYAEEFGVEFFRRERPWKIACDVAFPCAIQNELELADAQMLINNGCRYVVEGANMPTTNEAVAALQAAGVHFAPGKAANAGGVAVSGLEMAQNREGRAWSADKVDESLHTIMRQIHTICVEAAARYGQEGDYVVGANIGGFMRVAEAMIDQGAV